MIATRQFGRLAVRFLLSCVLGLLILNGASLIWSYVSADGEPVLSRNEAFTMSSARIEALQPHYLTSLINLDGLTLSAAAADGPCAPRGEPISDNPYRDGNAFYLCGVGEHFNTNTWGQNNVELWIACRAETRRAGVKWHIWCNADGSHCGCNRQDFIGGSSTCCQFTAGSHCYNGGNPGQNGCASW